MRRNNVDRFELMPVMKSEIFENLFELSTERLPTLSREEEERIIRLKKFVLSLVNLNLYISTNFIRHVLI